VVYFSLCYVSNMQIDSIISGGGRVDFISSRLRFVWNEDIWYIRMSRENNTTTEVVVTHNLLELLR
jgi:hypothetical protein